MLKFILLLFCANLVWSCNNTLNYCDPALCSRATQHIGCMNNDSLGNNCIYGGYLVGFEPFQNLVVNMHNDYRNRIAGGELKGLKSASRMGTMQWCDDLAKLAELNVKRCQMEHDRCRNTVDFRWSGQNLASTWVQGGELELIVKNFIQDWFNEHQHATMRHVQYYGRSTDDVAEFLTIANDRNIAVGCALLEAVEKGAANFLFTCNYAQKNVYGYQTYINGPTASKCKTGTNPDYKNLCSVSEQINPNENYLFHRR